MILTVDSSIPGGCALPHLSRFGLMSLFSAVFVFALLRTSVRFRVRIQLRGYPYVLWLEVRVALFRLLHIEMNEAELYPKIAGALSSEMIRAARRTGPASGAASVIDSRSALALFSRIRLEAMQIHFGFGAQNAAATAQSIGLAWAISGILIAIIGQISARCEPLFDVSPDFNKRHVLLDVRCIASVRPGDIILALLKHVLRSRRVENRDAAPHRRPYEDSNGQH